MTLQISDLDPAERVDARAVFPHLASGVEKGLYVSKIKRAFDTLLIALSLPFVLPITLVMAALVALDGHNPFYSQLRVGLDGKTFRLWKIRTMTHNADETLEKHLSENPDARAEWDHHQKLKNDPRITKVGRILRKTSLDELPQLFNVLIGDMALVGPRPMMVGQERIYKGSAYYDLRPGITGYWQVSDRHQTSFAERAYFDEKYGRDVSFKTDVATIAQTFSVVLRGTGC